jgi:hypothetical protein
VRTYSALLLFENLFDDIPADNPDMVNLGLSIFNPNLPVVENDCGTTLGRFETLTFESEGIIELATDEPLTRDRIEYLLSQGIYEIATRHTSSCISKGGICVKCYSASHPDQTPPKVNDFIKVVPEFLVNAEIITTKEEVSEYTLSTENGTYDKAYVYSSGQLLTEGVDYELDNGVLTVIPTPTSQDPIIVRCVEFSTFPFVVWLARTFSGSVLGMRALPSEPLPIRSLLLTSLLTENRLQLISEYVNELQMIPEDYRGYIDSIKDPLEKALYMLALYCLYSNVTS